MKALSLWQPWASAVALGLKHYETRGWKPPAALVGQVVAIHAAKKKDADCCLRWVQHKLGIPRNIMDMPSTDSFNRMKTDAAFADYEALPFGAIVCLVRIVRVWTTEGVKLRLSDAEISWGDYGPERFAWELELVYKFDTPIPFTGAQGFFNFEIPAAWVKAEADRAGQPHLYEIWKAVKGVT